MASQMLACLRLIQLGSPKMDFHGLGWFPRAQTCSYNQNSDRH